MKKATPTLLLALKEAEQAIRNYCNYQEGEDLPADLNFIWANIAIGLLGMAGDNTADALTPGGPLASIRMGDTSYSFASSQKSQQDYLDEVVSNYARQLNRFRRLLWE